MTNFFKRQRKKHDHQTFSVQDKGEKSSNLNTIYVHEFYKINLQLFVNIIIREELCSVLRIVRS